MLSHPSKDPIQAQRKLIKRSAKGYGLSLGNSDEDALINHSLKLSHILRKGSKTGNLAGFYSSFVRSSPHIPNSFKDQILKVGSVTGVKRSIKKSWQVFNILYDGYFGFDPALKEMRSSSGGPIALSSDFKVVLSAAMNKAVLLNYEEFRKKQSFVDWVSTRVLPDFKPFDVHLGLGMGNMVRTKPGSEISLGLIPEQDFETYRAHSYSTGVLLSRQALMNDDLGYLQDIVKSAAAAFSLESDLVYTELTSGTTEGSAAFSSSKGNLFTDSSLEKSDSHDHLKGLRSMINRFADVRGKNSEPLNLELGYLVVPPALKAQALQAKQELLGVGWDNDKDYDFKVVSDQRLSDFSNTSYYGVAKQAGSDMGTLMELGYVDKPRMTVGESSNSDSNITNDTVPFTLTHDVGVKFIDHRFAAKCEA